MRRGSFHRRVAATAAAVLGTISGCSSHSAPVAPTTSAPMAKATVKRVSNRAANTDGSVLIVEYHNISKKEARWDRSTKRFRGDLERLYALGFRPVTLTSYLDGRMELAPGASPVIFTFDDADPSQFRILPGGKIDPNCAVGIWRHFADRHPDFPVVATFFVLPSMWNQKDQISVKLNLLRKWGSELGCHTYTHRNLGKLSDAEVKGEIRRSVEMIKSYGFEPTAIALPFGVNPKNHSLLKGFSEGRHRYGFRAALLVGAEPAPPPGSKRLNPYRLPRVQSIEGPFGITYWLDRVKLGKVKPYVAP